MIHRARGFVALSVWLAAYRRDRRAVAAIEFALILPLMLLLYIGTTDVTRGVLASRKVGLVSRTLSDLMAQQSTTTTTPTTTVATIFNAASAIMQPYSMSSMTMTVSGATIKAKSSGLCCDVTIDWSYTQNGTLRPCSTPLTQTSAGTAPGPTVIPQNLVTANQLAGYTYTSTKTTYLIIADVTYAYQPFFSQTSSWFASAFRKTSFMVPRAASGKVTLTNATSAGTGQSGAICS